MACFIFPDKHLIVMFVLLYFVLLFCCHASCVLVNVTRNEQDIFSYPRIFHNCSGFCQKKESFVYKDLTKIGICICQCGSDYRTFVTAELRCEKDKVIRNTEQTSLKFKLYKTERPDGPLKIIPFDPVTIIMFLPPNSYNEFCDLNDIEELSDENVWQWNSVKDDLLSNYSIIEIDDDDIEKHYTWLDMKYEGWMMLKLRWRVNPDRFVGRLMRINVTCENSNTRPKKYMTGVMVFKVNGTFRVPDDTIPSSTFAPVVSTMYYLTPTPSTESSVFVYSTTSKILSTIMTSSPLIPMTSSSLQPMMPSSLQTVMSSSLETMTSSSLETMTSSSLETMTSSSLETMTSSSLETMTSSSLETMTSSSLGRMTSSSLETMTSSTMSPSRSSFSVLTESVFIYSSTLSSMALSSSSVAAVGPAKTSNSSSNGAVTGGVVAGLVVLLVIVVLLVYVLRKRRMTTIREKPHSDLGHINPNYPSLSNLQIIPALNNPLNDGVHVYENPEVINDGTDRRSGVISIDSAAYDSCLVVENPSANQKVKSVYDNIPESPENTYKALDPTKREPSAKYQSLIKNENEYSTVADSVSGAPIQEPLYSEIDRLPSPVPIRNGHGPRSPTPPPLTSRKSHTPVVAEPIYNELESSGNQAKEGGKPKDNRNSAPPCLPPRQPHIPAVAEPIYNELENSGSHGQENEESNDVTNEPEELNEIDGKNGPVYSELEDK